MPSYRALLLAVAANDLAKIRRLISTSAQVAEYARYATQRGRLAILRYLVSVGADLCVDLRDVVLGRFVATARFLISLGVNASSICEFYTRALPDAPCAIAWHLTTFGAPPGICLRRINISQAATATRRRPRDARRAGSTSRDSPLLRRAAAREPAGGAAELPRVPAAVRGQKLNLSAAILLQ